MAQRRSARHDPSRFSWTPQGCCVGSLYLVRLDTPNPTAIGSSFSDKSAVGQIPLTQQRYRPLPGVKPNRPANRH